MKRDEGNQSVKMSPFQNRHFHFLCLMTMRTQFQGSEGEGEAWGGGQTGERFAGGLQWTILPGVTVSHFNNHSEYNQEIILSLLFPRYIQSKMLAGSADIFPPIAFRICPPFLSFTLITYLHGTSQEIAFSWGIISSIIFLFLFIVFIQLSFWQTSNKDLLWVIKMSKNTIFLSMERWPPILLRILHKNPPLDAENDSQNSERCASQNRERK